MIDAKDISDADSYRDAVQPQSEGRPEFSLGTPWTKLHSALNRTPDFSCLGRDARVRSMRYWRFWGA
jgi:hypothetical protein